ncbi:uncharacterized protein B0I36DRAFT_313169 [Microdochium trichocladiopsis]|uniref:LITAF domain-containing protein n=1 Tax=Microdochium trichocladiopsis TaxID=1682393 RepID=A0A9P9BRN3_9PEZI|nr:uncharacterized protein B0I36DRAFT_313169 [Microdochium trichocladiopsis]KAH7037030.1 hypothetical protein B0I36DRAFT_313169 [Microdochium trichocladiopsis]
MAARRAWLEYFLRAPPLFVTVSTASRLGRCFSGVTTRSYLRALALLQPLANCPYIAFSYSSVPRSTTSGIMAPTRSNSASSTTHDSPPSYSASSTTPPSQSEKLSSNPFDPQPESSTKTTDYKPPVKAHSPLPYIDDGGLPEVVTSHQSVDIRPDIDPHKIREQQIYPHQRDSIASQSTALGSFSAATVTPLHLLGDQPDTVDCPFCQRRSITRVKKKPSLATHAAATGLFLTTIGGTVVPYAKQWKSHVSHYCNNCNRKVAQRRNGQDTMQPLGTPEHMREVSRYPAAA